jgi:putative ABC transport system substrate-binding protein
MLHVQRRLFLAATGALIAQASSRAQQRQATPTIAFLNAGSPSAADSRNQDAFRGRMAELGYVEGHNVVVEAHYSDGDDERLGQLAADLVRRKVDIILTTSTPATYAAHYATTEIPIVMASTFDAQVAGLVRSLAHPGGNITGMTSISYELFGKRMELIREVVPGLTRLGYLRRRASDAAVAQGERERALAAFNAEIARGMDAAARRLGISMQTVAVAGQDDLPAAFSEFARGMAQAVYLLESPALRIHRALIADLASRYRMPTISGSPDYTEAGCLLSYGSDFAADRVKVADYVDRILRGANPGDLPVQLPAKFEMVINMKTAKALGLRIPQRLLLRADRLIE